MQTFILGKQVFHKNEMWLVVRIIKESSSLFETSPGHFTRVDESYVQLRSITGEYDFVTIYEQETPMEITSPIHALPNKPWRVRNGNATETNEV